MKKSIAAESPDAYLAALAGWQHDCVHHLRNTVHKSAKLDEVIKWGHLVYLSNGPVLLIRAEERRVLFGFWRGQRLRDIDQRLKPGGNYEMATMTLLESHSVSAVIVRRLVREAVALNASLGDPTDIAMPPRVGRRIQRC